MFWGLCHVISFNQQSPCYPAKPRTPDGQWELRERHEQTLPLNFQKELTLLTPGSQTSGLRNLRE